MAQAPRDQNRVPALLATSNVDFVSTVDIWADPVTHALLVDATVSLAPNQSVNISQIAGTATSVNTGAADAGTIRVAVATGSSMTVDNGAGAAAVNIQDGGNTITVDGIVDITPNTAFNLAQVGGTATDTNSGNVSAGTLRVVLATDQPQLTNKLLVTPDANSSVNISQIAGGTAINSGVTGALAVGGDVANDSADSGNPMKIGGKALAAPATAVTANDRVQAMFDVYGRQISMSALREMRAQQVTTITSSTSETTIVTADATYYQDLYGLIITNTSATAVNVAIKDDTAGTTRINIAVPAGDTRGFMLPPDAGHKQGATNDNWTATCSASVASVIITAFVAKNL